MGLNNKLIGVYGGWTPYGRTIGILYSKRHIVKGGYL